MHANPNPERPQEQDDSDADADSQSSLSAADKDEFILVKLAEIRKEVQCPICLGIIRKTRTVMECLHRFCRECIDKSMRLGNNECPACRTHCASRRSLRDDPNYDALIAALYPDIDKYEEEELAFHEEEKNRNKKIQACIAETLRRQSDALGRRRPTAKATAAAFVRKSQGNFRTNGQNSYLRGRGRTGGRENALAVSDDEEEGNDNDGSKESSSADERSPDIRQKRCKRWPVPRSSPVRTASNADSGYDDNDDLGVSRENLSTSPLRAAWGKNGVRSQTRHGNASSSNGRVVKGARMTKLVEHLRNLDETDNQVDIHLIMLPLEGENMPNLRTPYLCCQRTMSIKQLCLFIACQTSLQAEEVQIYARTPQHGYSAINNPTIIDKTVDPFEGLQMLEPEKSLSELCASFTSAQGDLELVYVSKLQS
ncbi:putative E3 ubiquitin-protein ligase RING1a [Typha latifolia]|uniref:putative E3 ubiquitin-protein ligase RING1a n=1 Tax=Typha latifolia TaxID=4733 RepID=UPI003C2BDF57